METKEKYLRSIPCTPLVVGKSTAASIRNHAILFERPSLAFLRKDKAVLPSLMKAD